MTTLFGFEPKAEAIAKEADAIAWNTLRYVHLGISESKKDQLDPPKYEYSGPTRPSLLEIRNKDFRPQSC